MCVSLCPGRNRRARAGRFFEFRRQRSFREDLWICLLVFVTRDQLVLTAIPSTQGADALSDSNSVGIIMYTSNMCENTEQYHINIM